MLPMFIGGHNQLFRFDDKSTGFAVAARRLHACHKRKILCQIDSIEWFGVHAIGIIVSFLFWFYALL